VALGLLAFLVPLYVLPNHYAREFGMPLATLGAVLLAARLFDAISDPLLGRLGDHLFGARCGRVLGVGACRPAVLALGLISLFFRRCAAPASLVLGAHRAAHHLHRLQPAEHCAPVVGRRLGGDELQRGRIVAWREGRAWWGWCWPRCCPALLGLPRPCWGVCHHAAAGLVGLDAGAAPCRPGAPWPRYRPPPTRQPVAALGAPGLPPPAGGVHAQRHCQRHPGHAGAVLRAGPAAGPARTGAGMFLAAYFVCAALSIPLWLRAVGRFGLARTWLAGMLLAVAVFAWTATLGAGDACRSWWSARCPAWRLAPTWPCPAPCWPA
jgi:GPH family glycoside/pentoside/hexuronide:cation symporter